MTRSLTRLLAVRLAGPMLRRLDAHGATVNRTDIVRELLEKGLDGPPLAAVPAPDEPQDCLVSVRIPSGLVDRIDALTRSFGPTVSRSDVVRALFARALGVDAAHRS